MPRTKSRPIPAGRITPVTALFIAILLILLGLFTLTSNSVHSHELLCLSCLALVWYNGLYTYLKRVTSFAVVPGSLIGAIPPVIGYVAAGGEVGDPIILLVATFFFIWQIPHFWLLLQNFGEDYEKAGFPSLTRIFTPTQLRRITFTWIFATAVACLVIPLFGLVTSSGVQVGFLVAGFWLVWKALMLLRSHHLGFSLRPAFNSMNAYVLLVIFLLTLDHLL